MISFFNKIHFSNSVTPCLVEKEIEERKKKDNSLFNSKKKKKKKENKNDETQLAIFQQQNRYRSGCLGYVDRMECD